MATRAGMDETAARGRPAAARLWVQESGQPTTWHIVTERIAYQWYRMACGWELQLADAAAVWPAKEGEREPTAKTRCRSCVQMHEVTLMLGGPVFGEAARRAADRSSPNP